MTDPINSVEDFHNALMGEDELGVVLRAHFYVEAELEALIKALLPFPNEIPRLRYEQKLKLACALGLDKSTFPPLKALGDLRNSFGHRIGASLTPDMAKVLFESLSIDDRGIVLSGYNTTRSQMEADLPSFELLGPKDAFVIVAVALHKMLSDTISHAQAKRRT